MKSLKVLLETHVLREGDHFRWQYMTADEDRSLQYWCKSCMCIWNGKEFKDLFWSMGNSSESYTLPIDRVLLSFMGNINDYTKCQEHDLKYYDDADILNRQHSNNSANWGNCFFIKKGAQRSREKMKQGILLKLEEAEYEIRSATNKKNQALKELDDLNDPDYNIDNIYI